MRRPYDEYRELAYKPDKARGRESTEAVDLDALLEQYILSEQAGSASEMRKAAHDPSRVLVTAMSHVVPVSKKRYLALVRILADRVEKTKRDRELTTRRSAADEMMIKESDLEVCLLTDDTVVVSYFKK